MADKENLPNQKSQNLGFSYRIEASQNVIIERNGKRVTILRKRKAAAFIEKADALGEMDQQQLMARLSGNYKRGNEKRSKDHARNNR